MGTQSRGVVDVPGTAGVAYVWRTLGELVVWLASPHRLHPDVEPSVPFTIGRVGEEATVYLTATETTGNIWMLDDRRE